MPPSTCFYYIVIPSDETQAIQCLLTENGQKELETVANDLIGRSINLTLLIRPTSDAAGLYAYSSTISMEKNTRATRLAMACGLLSIRLLGHVIMFRSKGSFGFVDLTLGEIQGTACGSPDLREQVQVELAGDIESTDLIPEWLATASQQNYHDAVVLAQFAAVMDVDKPTIDGGESDSSVSSDNSDRSINAASVDTTKNVIQESVQDQTNLSLFVAKSSLCLHCRGPTESLCQGCYGAYFCSAPRGCRQLGWSHDCICATWKLYTDRRDVLSTFPFGDWHKQLLGRDCQISDHPYRKFLHENVGIDLGKASWWRTEGDGWAGGNSFSAKTVEIRTRLSFQDGFNPIREIPPERRVTDTEINKFELPRNSCGLLTLPSWKEYYELRGIPLSSPCALLLSFPLTIYHAIVEYGEVPVMVARILKRVIRVHVVGIEKELNFIDLFKEIGLLLPEDTKVELVFVVRDDMLPLNCRGDACMKVHLTTNLTLIISCGTYGDDLNPNFDCGSGPPDMVIGLNAGLFAYESWRSVVTFLHRNTGIVGVFTDYNEHSGMHCASVGGSHARNSLCINPFRQPLALPVYSMNLPQFSNAFLYVYNQQELEL